MNNFIKYGVFIPALALPATAFFKPVGNRSELYPCASQGLSRTLPLNIVGDAFALRGAHPGKLSAAHQRVLGSHLFLDSAEKKVQDFGVDQKRIEEPFVTAPIWGSINGKSATRAEQIAFLAQIFSLPNYAIIIAQVGITIGNLNLTKIAQSLGGEAIYTAIGLGPCISYEKTFNHPETGDPVKRYYAIYSPNSLPVNELRRLAATLKIGNPRSYGTPGVLEEPLSARPTQGATANQSVKEILNQNYVITIRNTSDGKFGALAVLHSNKYQDPCVAYIGQVVNGPRDPMAGLSTPLLGSELNHIVKGGGTLAVSEVINLAAQLGFGQSRLYTDRASLGERLTLAETGETIETFYDKFGQKLGLEVDYCVVNRVNPTGVRKLPEGAVGQVGQDDTQEYHYCYGGLARLRSEDTCS